MRYVLLFILIQSFFVQGQTVGVLQYDSEATEGYSIINPLPFDTSYLVDNCGKVINQWPCDYLNGVFARVTENGTFLKSAVDPNASNFTAGGAAGILLEYDWDGTVLWEYLLSDSTVRLHHDVEVLPNGNLLTIAWELYDAQASEQAGRDPNNLPTGELWMPVIYEIQPVYPDTANIVWEWHGWDHLVQDFDPTKDNFGSVSDNFRRLDINKGNPVGVADWAHLNGIDYNQTLDHILLSAPMFNELWIIDHSTTIAQAADSVGGNSGLGGNLLWRWGNPQSYNVGGSTDQQLFFQHNAKWVTNGTRFTNSISVYSNRDTINGALGSKIKILHPSFDSVANEYPLFLGQFLPDSAEYTYELVDTLFSPRLSGAQILPNDHLLICSGSNGQVIEIDTNETVLWNYLLPIDQQGNFVAQDSILQAPLSLFTVYRYPTDYLGFIGQDMTAGAPLELSPYPCSVVSLPNELTNELNVRAYPNPFNESFMLESESPIGIVRVYDTYGHLIFKTTAQHALYINAYHWSKGLYHIHIGNSASVLRISKT